jgi:hypothetical protein
MPKLIIKVLFIGLSYIKFIITNQCLEFEVPGVPKVNIYSYVSLNIGNMDF